jgi:hypothetical protein
MVVKRNFAFFVDAYVLTSCTPEKIDFSFRRGLSIQTRGKKPVLQRWHRVQVEDGSNVAFTDIAGGLE